MSATFTVLGSRGYIGSCLTGHLRSLPGATVHTDAEGLPAGSLGHVFFCVGVTTDFWTRLHDTMRAHVGEMMNVLDICEFDSVTYLSSTRVYERGVTGEEDTTLQIQPAELADYYKISKIAGEAVCLAHHNPAVRVVRLSNVIGFEQPPLTFVPSIINDACRSGRIVLNTALDSAKDYITLEDTVSALVLIALGGKERIYNLCSGQQTSHQQIVERIASQMPCEWTVRAGAQRAVFPATTPARLRKEFGFEPSPVLDALPGLCRRYLNDSRLP
jgi:nucleoside-diphosphate-sugar epimerase